MSNIIILELNIVPTKTNHEKKSFKKFHGKKSNVIHVRIFGNIAHVYIAKEDDSTSIYCRLIGYGSESIAYTVYCLKRRIVIITSDVIYEYRVGYFETRNFEKNMFLAFNRIDVEQVEVEEIIPSAS